MKTKLNDQEPVITGDFPVMTQLKAGERKIYDTWFKFLKDAGVLQPTDVYILAAWAQLAYQLSVHGAVKLPVQTLVQFRRLSTDLGLTPAARARLKAKPSDPTDPLDRFFEMPAG